MQRHSVLSIALLTSILQLGTLFSSECSLAFENPELSLNIKRVEPSGAVELVKSLSVASWTFDPVLCYDLEFNDSKLTTDPSTWVVTEEKGASAKVREKNLVSCVNDRVSNFSVQADASSFEREHYLIEVTSEPVLALAPACQFADAKSELTGDFIGVGLKCKPSGKTNSIRARFGHHSQALQIRYGGKRFRDGSEFKIPLHSTRPIVLEVTDTKNEKHGTITLETLNEKTDTLTEPEENPIATPTPAPSPGESPDVIVATSPSPSPSPLASPTPTQKLVRTVRRDIPLEILAGMTSQTRTANFFDGSPDNQSKSDTFVQVKAFRRARLPFPFKQKFLSDLHYSLQGRVDLGSISNIDAAIGLLKPVSIWNSLNTLIGIDFQYATTLNTVFGVKRFMAPSLDLQVETFSRSMGVRTQIAYVKPSFMKADAEIFYVPPFQFLHGIYVGADLSYLAFPKSSTSVLYDFTETRLGILLGYRFGERR